MNEQERRQHDEQYAIHKRSIRNYFSGADMIVVMNGKIYGEISGVNWKESFVDGTTMGIVKLIYFDRDPLKELIGQNIHIHIRYVNEEEQWRTIDIVDAQFEEKVSTNEIDQAVLEYGYTFKSLRAPIEAQGDNYKEQIGSLFNGLGEVTVARPLMDA